MTPAQNQFYLTLCNRALRAHGWKMAQGRLLNGTPNEQASSMAEAVIARAHELAALEHRAPNTRDLRLAVHSIAVKRPCSSKQLTGREFTRVRWLLELLIDENNLEAMNEWSHPELDQQRAAEASLRAAPAAIVESISQARFGTRQWATLDLASLKSLAITVRNRIARKPDFA